ncbi:MAG: hypothetical protein DDT25_00558 [Chloroflexi bacterium]|nr:hypothetical protein [Chloroflexota bacterium]
MTLFDVQVYNEKVLLELLGARDGFTTPIQYHAASVEDQLVLTAHQIGVSQDHRVFGGPMAEHLLSEVSLPGMIGRGADVQYHLGSGRGLT